MPGQDGGRIDRPVAHRQPGEEPDRGGEDGPVGPVHARPGIGPAQGRVLVAQDQDLYVLGRAAAGEQGELFGGAAEREIEQAQRHDQRSPAAQYGPIGAVGDVELDAVGCAEAAAGRADRGMSVSHRNRL